MELPIYNVTIDTNDEELDGVDAIALVDDPAIERDWQLFKNNLVRITLNTDKQREKFQVKDEEKRLISGPAMVADLPIYRRDEARGEFFVKFSKDTIRDIVFKFFRNGFGNSINKMHDPSDPANGVFIVESMIIDEARGVRTPLGFDELPEGSWFVTMRCEDDEIWNEFIKTGVFNGFSVEGRFDLELAEVLEEEQIERIIEAIQG